MHVLNSRNSFAYSGSSVSVSPVFHLSTPILETWFVRQPLQAPGALKGRAPTLGHLRRSALTDPCAGTPEGLGPQALCPLQQRRRARRAGEQAELVPVPPQQGRARWAATGPAGVGGPA